MMVTYLFIFAFTLVLILPILLLVMIGQRRLSRRSQDAGNHSLVRFGLLAYLLIAIPFIAISIGFGERSVSLPFLLVLPALDGLLALLLINIRQVYDFWLSERRLAALLLLAIIASLLIAAWINPALALLLVLPSLLVALIWMVGSRIAEGWLASLAILVIAALILDALGIAGSHAVFSQVWLHNVYKIASGLVALLALVLAGVFIHRAFLSSEENARHKGIYLLMAGLLLFSLAAVTFRLGVLTKATGRAYEDHLPFVTIATGLVIGFLLAFALSGSTRRLGVAFFLLTTVTIILAYSLGWRVDYEAVTASRIERLDLAISHYRQDTGQYPQQLADLTPGYLPLIFGPLSGRGQEWCYQSGPDYYRLGYVYFQRYYQYPDNTPYWEPYYEIKVPYTAGQLPQGEWICDQELLLFKRHGGL